MEQPPAATGVQWTESQFHGGHGRKAPSKSNSSTLCKALIVVILLLVIPLFPSQAPDFVTQSVFTEFWEILHLLFIGIAVSYGLFCRKPDRLMNPEEIVRSRSDESSACLSGISHLSSFFEDGFDNMYAPDEHDVMHAYGNCGQNQILGGNHECVVDGGSKIRAFVSNDVNADNFEGNVRNVDQTWCSQYVKSESLTVVSNGKYFVGENSDFAPLNLPIRSLRSMVVDNEKPESNYCTKIEAKSFEVLKLRGVVPMNLEKKFDEVAGPSSIPWRSNSGRVGSKEDKSTAKLHAHCRPHSVGEVEFERIKSSVPQFSSSPELVGLSEEHLEKGKVFSGSRSKVTPLNGEVLFGSARSRGNCREEDKVGKGKLAMESLESEIKSSALGRVLSKAKSVRTIKPRRYADEKELRSSQKDHRLERMRSKFGEDTFAKRGSGNEPENALVDHQGHQSDAVFPMLNSKSMSNEFHNEEEEGIDDHNITESEDKTGTELDKHLGEDNPRKSNLNIDSEQEGSEVDRKAGEFIAKFREQIRLQKVSSAEG